ncbi:MAG: AAA family ATPase [Sulfurovum sp.]|nr:AAA family ATPase [Sulfurovaceae bacterium]
MKYKLAPEFVPIVNAIEAHLIGKRYAITLTLSAYLAGGHVLLEDIPGVGKTTLAKQFCAVLGLDFGRIQFTSDMLPSDILGISFYNQKEGKFTLRKGAIFTQFLLSDEINRAMPKTQSALLEAMEEGNITIDSTSYPLPSPFFVIGTQNPHEEVGTFPLPHSQLDRFICSFGIGYPDRESEREILKGINSKMKPQTEALVTYEDIIEFMKRVKDITLSDAMITYIQDVIAFTRESDRFEYGLSTRGALALTAMIKSWAMLHGRTYAIPDDLQAVTGVVCSHRLKFIEGNTTSVRLSHEIFAHIHPDA